MPEENALQQTHLTFSAAVTVLGCVCVCVCLVEVTFPPASFFFLV